MPTSTRALANIWPSPLPNTLDPIGAGLLYFTHPSTRLHPDGQDPCGGCNPLFSSSRLASMLPLPNCFLGFPMPPGQTQGPGLPHTGPAFLSVLPAPPPPPTPPHPTPASPPTPSHSLFLLTNPKHALSAPARAILSLPSGPASTPTRPSLATGKPSPADPMFPIHIHTDGDTEAQRGEGTSSNG